MEIWILILLALTVVLLTVILIAFFLFASKQSAESNRSPEIAAGMRQLGADLRSEQALQRRELQELMAATQKLLDERIRAASESQGLELAREREARSTSNRELYELLDRSLNQQLAKTLKTSLDENATKVRELTDSNAIKHDEMRKSLQTELEKLRSGNELKLEQMRATVDEKLQGTLEKRLGESFALVSDRLEQVQKGLGEMKTLASDVGGLKRVLTNVKNRGAWGEVQLARQLEDMFTRDQYEENVAIKPESDERVEFAIRLPGTSDLDGPIYLPIDSKFPQEDYERLLSAQDEGEKESIERALKNVERAIIEEAKRISTKYIEPPHSTDFAIMYLPTEGLFAEVVRRSGLASKVQNEYRVMITGPSTLMAILTSLQMGFRTLAIEKRSSEVWQVLSAAKHEFEKYGRVWEKLEKQLSTAQNTVREAGRRSRVLHSKLRKVESVDFELEATPLTQLFEDSQLFDEITEISETDT